MSVEAVIIFMIGFCVGVAAEKVPKFERKYRVFEDGKFCWRRIDNAEESK